jgi:hypothetical protein
LCGDLGSFNVRGESGAGTIQSISLVKADLATPTAQSITKALSHGFKLLRGGSGEDVHPPRESVKLGHEDGSTKGHDHGSDHHHHHHHHHHGEHKHHHATAKTALSKDPSAAGKNSVYVAFVAVRS